MSDTARKTSPLSGLKKVARTAERKEAEERSQRDDAFRLRVAQQQFMNANAPLFRALALRGRRPAGAMDGDDLRGLAEAANRLASAVASKVLGRPEGELDPLDVKPLRQETAAFVAGRFDAGAEVDVETDASAIAKAVALADPAWDVNAFRQMKVSPDASVAMTAAGVAAGLTMQSMVYDFRQDRSRLVGRLTSMVVDAAMSSAREMLAPDAGSDDCRTMVQSLAKHMGGIMESCYERKAREVAGTLSAMSEEERRTWYAKHDPVAEVTASFTEWSRCFAGFALATTRGMTAAGKSGTVKGNRP